MVRHIKSSFELKVFDQKLSAPKQLEQFLSIYVSYFSPLHRTDTNQLLYYMKNPLPGRRIIYFGLCFEGKPIGFCVLMYYPAKAIGVFDFMVIAPNRRGEGAFHVFTTLIAEFLERARIVPNYLVAEILLSEGPLAHGFSPAAMMRLLRPLRFRRVKMEYTAPDPSIVQDPKGCRAVMMLVVEPDRESLPASELIRLIELVYLDHYLLWFTGFMTPDEAARYEAAVRAECTRLTNIARRMGTVVLNGVRDSDIALVPQSERRQLSLAILGATVTTLTIVLALIDAPEVTAVLLGGAAATLLGALFSARFRAWLLRLFGQAE